MRSAVIGVVSLALYVASAVWALAGETVQVKISDLAFSPAEITARVGDTIQWVNGDFVDHTATAKGRRMGCDDRGWEASGAAAHPRRDD